MDVWSAFANTVRKKNCKTNGSFKWKSFILPITLIISLEQQQQQSHLVGQHHLIR